jgi:hypothetical protein
MKDGSNNSTSLLIPQLLLAFPVRSPLSVIYRICICIIEIPDTPHLLHWLLLQYEVS